MNETALQETWHVRIWSMQPCESHWSHSHQCVLRVTVTMHWSLHITLFTFIFQQTSIEMSQVTFQYSSIHRRGNAVRWFALQPAAMKKVVCGMKRHYCKQAIFPCLCIEPTLEIAHGIAPTYIVWGALKTTGWPPYYSIMLKIAPTNLSKSYCV